MAAPAHRVGSLLALTWHVGTIPSRVEGAVGPTRRPGPEPLAEERTL